MAVITPPNDPVHTGAAPAVDAAVEAVRAGRAAWAGLPVRARIGLVDELTQGVLAVADRWSQACAAAQQLAASDPVSGESALVGPYLILRFLRLLRRSLIGIERQGVPPLSSHRTANLLARELVRFESRPSVLRVPRILALALRG